MARFKRFFGMSLLFILWTLLLLPWRDSVSQDDGHYAASAISLASGVLEPHPLNNAAAWFQLFSGATLLKMFPALPSLAVLNGLTWAVFAGVIVLFSRLTGWRGAMLASLFGFPIWIQYGASYLSDVYGAFLLLGFFLGFERAALSKASLGWVTVLSALLPLQQQTLVAFPVFTGIFSIFLASSAPSDRARFSKAGAFALAGSFVGLLVYALALPTTELQKGYLWFRKEAWASLPMSLILTKTLISSAQLTSAVGLFLIPCLQLKAISKRTLGWAAALQLLVFLALMASSEEILGAGILFTGYFPRFLSALLVSAGVWGWVASVQALPYRAWARSPASWGVLAGSVVILAFSVFREVQDIRYVMLIGLLLTVVIARIGHRDRFLGESPFYWVPLLLVSLIVNQYNLNTTEARWQEARRLEASGAARWEISAGYGRDVFVHGAECAQRAIERLKAGGGLRTSEAIQRYFIPTSRLYEDGWEPRYLVKPSRIFGKEVQLSKNRKAGQELAPRDILPYSFFGLKNLMALSVIDTGRHSLPWCISPHP